ncbi:MAG: YceI family protein [Blastocatellia bacterium]|nr:YceI family protein [Blastocatellia bacterium]
MKNHRTNIIVLLAALAVIAGLSFAKVFGEAPAASFQPGVEAPAPLAPSSAAVRYSIDAGKSNFIVRAFAGGLFSAFGHDHTIAIRGFSGEAQLTPDSIQPASLQMTIKAASLAVTDKVSDSDRQEIEKTMREEVLETGKYSEIVFKSTRADFEKTGEGQYRGKIFGDLTLHGVTRNIPVTAQLTLSGNTLRARGQFSLNQSSYNIKRVSVAAGTINVKDELKFSFDIIANKQ